LRLSQGQLNLLETCPRKFQQTYLEQLGSLTALEQLERLIWGSQFHLLMQQRELGLPVAAIALPDNPLQQCVDALIQAAPEVFTQEQQTFRQSEHRRTLEWQGHLLTVVYDLLILNEQQAQILDWKTYPRPQKRHWLERDWQTRLYPFVLAETSDYAAEQISMTYWFVRAGGERSPQPQPLRFNYSTALHHQTEKDLSQLLRQLNQWLQEYEAGQPFPAVEETTGRCQSCQFAMRCQRQSEQSLGLQEQLPALADIPEVVL
jgi:PD-(D/E)XK nuclease superfamily